MKLRFLAVALALLAGCAPRSGGGRGGASLTPTRGGGLRHAASGGSAAPTPDVRFTDVTSAAGLHFKHVNGASGRFYLPESMGSGGAFLDYDGDGWLDLFLVNSRGLPGYEAGANPANALYHNNRDGTFTDVTKQAGLSAPMYGMGVCAGDYDGDGRTDLYVTGLESGRLFRNEGDGRFSDVTRAAGVGNEGHWGTSCAWLDYDLDGRLDLFVCNYVRYQLDRELTCRQGGLRTYCGPLVYAGEKCRLYRNLGGGRFRDVSAGAGILKASGKSLGVAVWDFDGDRYPEIVVANDLTPNLLFRNLGNGSFREMGLDSGIAYGGDGTARSGMGIDVADTLNDGRCAIFISNYAREPNSFFTWQDRFSFSDRTYEAGIGEASLQPLGFGLVFFDYDNDGWKDAFVTNGHIQPDIARYEPPQTHEQRPLLYHNRRDGTFAEVAEQLGGALMETGVGRGAASGDYDNDGDLDLLVTNNDGPARLLRNDGGNQGSWLTLRLIGRTSNRDGLGAEVRVRVGGRALRDQARSGSSYLSANDPRLHFGLGSSRQADEVEVRWPSRAINRLARVPANQVLEVTEAESH